MSESQSNGTNPIHPFFDKFLLKKISSDRVREITSTTRCSNTICFDDNSGYYYVIVEKESNKELSFREYNSKRGDTQLPSNYHWYLHNTLYPIFRGSTYIGYNDGTLQTPYFIPKRST